MARFGRFGGWFLVLLWAVSAGAQEKPQIGLKVGETVPMIPAIAVNGPYAGKKTCYTCSYRGAATVYVFVNDEGAVPRVVQLDRLLQKRAEQGLKGVFIALVGPEYKGRLRVFVQTRQVKTPVAYLEKGAEDAALKAWKLPRFQGLALVVAAHKKVVATFVNPGKKDLPRLEEAVRKALQEAKKKSK
jgi:hypothetical protein